MNLATTTAAADKGATDAGLRFVASGIIRRRVDHQEWAIISEVGDFDRSAPLARRGDTRRQVTERLAGGAR